MQVVCKKNNVVLFLTDTVKNYLFCYKETKNNTSIILNVSVRKIIGVAESVGNQETAVSQLQSISANSKNFPFLKRLWESRLLNKIFNI